jgi:hypothetical protein
MTSVQEIWNELAAPSRNETGWNARRVGGSSSAGILLAVRKPDNIPALLIEVPALAVPPIAEYPTAEGFHVVPEPMISGPKGRVRLCLVLADERYGDVFSTLVDDVIADLAHWSRDEDLVRGLLARLQAWQIFMRRHGPSRLETEAQIGLAAELFFMRDWILARIPARETVAAWTGPLGSPQDFILPGVAIEVKASTTPQGQEIRISSLEQLDSHRCRTPLLVCWMKLAPEAEPLGASLPRIISELRETLGSKDRAALGLFEERLLEAGYLDAHAKHYEQRLYRTQIVKLFSVSGAFPRIERNEVREGILSCSYMIRLSTCGAFEVSAAEADHLIRQSAA